MTTNQPTPNTTSGSDTGGHETARPHEAGHYEIRVAGRLTPHWSAWFDGMTVTPVDDGITVIDGTVVDQAALHGLLQRLRDVGLPLISVTRTPSRTAVAGHMTDQVTGDDTIERN